MINMKKMQQLADRFLLSPEKAKMLIKEHGIEYVNSKVEFIQDTKTYKEGKIDNITGYLIDAVKKDYKYSSLAEINAENRKKKNEQEVVEIISRRKSEKIRKDYEKYVMGEYIAIFEKLDNSEKSLIFSKLEKIVNSNHATLRTSYKNYGIKAPFIREDLKEIIKTHDPKSISSILDFEAFQNLLVLQN